MENRYYVGNNKYAPLPWSRYLKNCKKNKINNAQCCTVQTKFKKKKKKYKYKVKLLVLYNLAEN